MAQVISIRERMPRTPRRNEPGIQDAQVLLFTGIRYERFDATQERVELNDKGEPIRH